MDVKERLLLIKIVAKIHKSPAYAANAGIKDNSRMINTNSINKTYKIGTTVYGKQ